MDSDKLNEVKKYLKEHPDYGYYLTNDEKYVGDAYGPMSFGRYTEIDEFYSLIKENQIYV